MKLPALPSVCEQDTPPQAATSDPDKLRLLVRVRRELQARHYATRTERTYINWIKRYIRFHQLRHPAVLRERDINHFLTYLAVELRVSSATQNQALAALLFLYRHVLGREVGDLGEVVRARASRRLPVVLSVLEVTRVLSALTGVDRVIASLLYGAGLRLMESLQLRVQDVDFGQKQILVRSGKGDRDRITVLPDGLERSLREQLAYVRTLHEQDLAAGFGQVMLPGALARKYPQAAIEWRWQFLFPQTGRWRNAETGTEGRHFRDPSLVQRSVRHAVLAAL